MGPGGGQLGAGKRPRRALRPKAARAAAVAALALVVLCAVVLAARPPAAAPRAEDRPAGPPTQTVSTEGGELRGFYADGVAQFRGIPYAAPPVGDLRWRPPRPAVPWHGVRDCVTFGASCPQSVTPVAGLPASQDEDCLYLNVWSPDVSRRARLPVMVWIHGGGYISGSGALPGAGGAMLAGLQRVVVVSINYRLGVFGFFAHPRLSAESPQHVSGNYGLLDQVAALRWVRRNIAAFGGDPRRVTIFGQSAGGQSVIAQLCNPLSKGLFARAIAESPRYQDHGVGTWNTLTLAEQEQEGRLIQSWLRVPDGPGTLEALRRVNAARLVHVTMPGRQPWPLLFVRPTMPSFQPVVDGYVLPDETWKLLRSGRFARVPLMIGTNADECNMWLTGVAPDQAGRVADAARERVRWFTGDDYDRLARWFPASEYGGELPATSRMMTVLEFAAPARYAAACVTKHGVPAYLYAFSRTPPGDPWGARHGAELPYVFGSVCLPAMQSQFLAGGTASGAVSGPREATAAASSSAGVPAGADQALSRRMMRYWASFAATGDPNALGQPPWPAYDPGADALLELDVLCAASPAPYAEACELAEEASQTH